MRALELILKLDKLKPNDIDDDIKKTWLTNAFWQVVTEIIDKHEGAKDHSEYDLEDLLGSLVVKTSTDLLVDEPYDELYVYYMKAQIDLAYDETDKYNKHMMLFNTAFDNFAKHYRQNHRPIGVKSFTYYGG